MPTLQAINSRSATCFLIALAYIACTSTQALGDTLKLKNGREYQGILVSQDDSTVVFEVQQVGVRMTIRRPISEVDQVATDSGLTYCVIRLVGPIGRDLNSSPYVTANAFIRALDEIKTVKPDYVLLAINSPGGSVGEMNRIVQAIAEANDLNFVAYVLKAHSAAAVIAMTCPDIIMAPNSSIGAAVPYRLGPDGTPQNIQEKLLSAIRAGFRNAVTHGEHSPLLIRGMSEIAIELSVIDASDGPIVVENDTDVSGRIIKHSGEILTLTASEALDFGLSKATVTSMRDIREALGVESWNRTLNHVKNYLIESSNGELRRARITHEQRQKQLAIELAERQRQADRQNQIDRVAPSLAKIDRRLAELDAQSQSARKTAEDYQSQLDRQIRALEFEYQALRNESLLSRDPVERGRALHIAFQREYAVILSKYEPHITAANERINKAEIEAEKLRKQRSEIVKSIPRR